MLFLTTNRVDDVDDAIASRCIATIRYAVPKEEDARRIWNVLADQFQFPLTEELVDNLVMHFSGVSGRDIKELLKLTAKWCRQKNVTPTLEVFKTCAQFRDCRSLVAVFLRLYQESVSLVFLFWAYCVGSRHK